MVPALSLAAPFWKGQPLCGTSTIESTAQMPCGRGRRLGDGACRSQLHILRRQQYQPRPPYPLSADRFRHDPWSPDVTHAVRTPRCHRQLKWRLNVVSVHNRHLRRKETFALRGRDSPAVPIGSSHGIVVTGQTLVRPPGPTNSLGPRHFGGARICARGAKAGLHAKPLQHPGRAGGREIACTQILLPLIGRAGAHPSRCRRLYVCHLLAKPKCRTHPDAVRIEVEPLGRRPA